MALGYCQCLLKCLCITVPPRIPSPRISPTTYSVTTYFPHHVFRHHVFPPPRIPSPRVSSTTYSDLHPATTTTTATDELLLGRYDLLLERYRLRPYYYYYLSGTPLNILWA